MKEIFNDIRKEIDIHSDEACFMPDDMMVVSESWLKKKLDEAEAKWESDCCIRVVGKPFTSSCGQKYDKWTYVGEPYCAKCGKPIKISEVSNGMG